MLRFKGVHNKKEIIFLKINMPFISSQEAKIVYFIRGFITREMHFFAFKILDEINVIFISEI